MTKNDSEAVVNVNLTPCMCVARAQHQRIDLQRPHFEDCSGRPALVPCPIPPSVTFTVRLGECAPSCSARGRAALTGGRSSEHYADCPARPIRVSCSIGGDGTWAGSEVTDVEGPLGAPVDLIAVCRDRWALAKALVTNDWKGWAFTSHGSPIQALQVQRDALFSLLAEMVRLEDAAAKAQELALRIIGGVWIDPGGCPGHSSTLDGRRPSVVLLGRWVTRMIDEVGHRER